MKCNNNECLFQHSDHSCGRGVQLTCPMRPATGYDDKGFCIECNEPNTIVVKDSINHETCECETTCSSCNHKDYWSYGLYESRLGN